MKTNKTTVELRKILNGQLFRLPCNNVLYVRDDYFPRSKSFICHPFDSVGVNFLLSVDTPVYRASIA